MRLRRWRLKCFFVCTMLMVFTSMWIFMTLLIIAAQEQRQDMNREEETRQKEEDYMGRGVQVIVGHFNGKMPDEKTKRNFSREELDENNYNPVIGIGDNGVAVRLNASDEHRSKEFFSINQFNLVASDMIALNRSLPDVRKNACRKRDYGENLPTTSVIIVFHNEAWSTLLRTVHSVITRSPAKYLREIILVDDASDRQFLQEPLEKYVQTLLPTSVIVLRAKTRTGLIRARLMGAQRARGDILTFLDSHCECTIGWLEPLLARIAEDRTVAVCPVIDVINDQTFAYQRGIELFRGGFNWNLQFRWYSVPPAELDRRGKDAAAPIQSPTMAGGLFSIDRKYFYEVGSYDNQMDIWGGENLEMSFRIWQCGGKVEILPCSHVGHVFRKASPHDFPDKGSGTILNSNLVRVAEVWMDEYKYLFYKTAPQAEELSQHIDTSQRKALREKLKCKDFGWYLDNVWPQHFLPRNAVHFGRVSNPRVKQCLVSTPGAPGKRQAALSLGQCTIGFDLWQIWIYTSNGQLKSDEHMCLHGAEISSTWVVQVKECYEGEMEKWHYHQYKQQMIHVKSGLCLDNPFRIGSHDETKVPTLRKCARDASSQHWIFMPIRWKP